MNDSFRGSGRTTRQMQEAPVGAVFIWVSARTDYAIHLADRIDRQDLSILGPSYLENAHWQGQELTGLVLDHYAQYHLTDGQWRGYQEAMTRVRK